MWPAAAISFEVCAAHRCEDQSTKFGFGSEGRGGVFYAKLPFVPMPESFNPMKAGRISVPDENYTTLNTFWLLASVLRAAS